MGLHKKRTSLICLTVFILLTLTFLFLFRERQSLLAPSADMKNFSDSNGIVYFIRKNENFTSFSEKSAPKDSPAFKEINESEMSQAITNLSCNHEKYAVFIKANNSLNFTPNNEFFDAALKTTQVQYFSRMDGSIDERIFTVHGSCNTTELLKHADSFHSIMKNRDCIAHSVYNNSATEEWFHSERKIKITIPKYVIDEASASVDSYFNNIGNHDILLDNFHFNLFIAATNSKELELASTFDSLDDIFVLRDFYYYELQTKIPEKYLQRLKDNVFVIKGFSTGKITTKLIELGIAPENRDVSILNPHFNTEVMAEVHKRFNERNILQIYLGTAQRFTAKDFEKTKTILLDEMYPYIDRLPVENQQYNMNHIEKALEATHILYKRGWVITSFVGRNKEHAKFFGEKYPWIKLHIFESVSHKDYVELLLKKNTFYFSHYLESYGLPYYECLQSGIPVFLFSENAPALVFRNMENSVMFSARNSAKTIATLIEEYYDLFDESLFNMIREDARQLFAAETFGERLLEALKRSGQINLDS